ncbi:MAG: glycosyl hydrolase family 28 protein [Akkermansiaceae bacterium]|nr:glycosyl hydrolase family 28 protein [Akkermansiaceae bacterium]
MNAVVAVISTASVLAVDFPVVDHGAKPDDEGIDTAGIQKAIDAAAAAGGGRVVFAPGLYRSGAIFVKSRVNLHLDEGVVLQAVQDDALFPDRPTRVAGVEMEWPAALVNVYQESEVTISGPGVIDGNGTYWWHKFWGKDGKGGMLKDYQARGLRWAVDYDCKRVRALAVFDSKEVNIRDVKILRSGFWSLTLTYSENIEISGVKIRANIGGFGPSSDGIDIDSCRHVLVENCDIDCNDDNICLKAGRDSDGLRVNRPTEHITIRNCITRSGHGMLTLGSETSGGIRHVRVENLTALGTANGVRIKSAKVRGGVIEDVKISGLDMRAVDYPFHFELNWYPQYSYPTLPEGVDPKEIPPHWVVMTTPVVPAERGIPEVRDIEISGVKATGALQALYGNAYEEKPMSGIRFRDVTVEAEKAGSLAHAKDWSFEDTRFRVVEDEPLKLVNTERVLLPEMGRIDRESWKTSREAIDVGDGDAIQLGVGTEEDAPAEE